MGRVSVKNVSRVFTKKEENSGTEALRNVSFDVEDGEFICLLGPSGCGKTTLLRIIAGLETQTSGEITLNGVPITGPDPKRGMVFQQYSLLPWRTVIDNVTFGLEMQGVNKAEARKHVEKYIDLVGLEQFKNSYPYELSGGMQQRAAIARALANEPEVLLMDEPFGALDSFTRETMQQLLVSIWAQTKKQVFFITHSIEEALTLGTHILVMSPRPGRIVARHQTDFVRKFADTGEIGAILADPAFVALREEIRSLIHRSHERSERQAA